MTKDKFLEKLTKLLDEFEAKNDNCIVGCSILFPTGEYLIWDGEKFR